MKLWYCGKSYWVVIVRAETVEKAEEMAEAAWQREEGWESPEDWFFRECSEEMAIVGWT